jgi:hypothetical protein
MVQLFWDLFLPSECMACDRQIFFVALAAVVVVAVSIINN